VRHYRDWAWMTYEGGEEEDDVHDGKGKAGLEHGACLVDVQRPVTAALTAIVAKGTQTEVDASAAEFRAVLVCDGTQLVDSGNQGAYESEVDECNEQGRVTSAQVCYERC